jgi:glutaryl-CoA dehydrogenase
MLNRLSKINFIKLSEKLNTEQKLIVDSTRSFAESYLKPRVVDDYQNENTDKEIFKEFGKMGILGPTIKGYGCLGGSYLTYGLIAKEIENIDSGYRSMFSVQSSLVMGPINQFGTEEQKEKYLPKLASGELIGCFGLTEPDFGSNPADMKTNAVKTSDNNYILNGSKTWITNSPIADVLVVWAKESTSNQIKGFIIDRDSEGLETPHINGKLSLRTSVTGMIQMDDVIVPKENVLNVTGLKGPFSCLNNARLGISFGALGAAESCINSTLNYTLDRNLFGTPLAQKQLIQYKLADMISEYNLALLSSYHVADLVDKNNYSNEMISFVKRNSCIKSLNIARTCRDILGGNGISIDYEVFRHMCNLETVNTYEGTHDIHSLILGKYFTGLSSF